MDFFFEKFGFVLQNLKDLKLIAQIFFYDNSFLRIFYRLNGRLLTFCRLILGKH